MSAKTKTFTEKQTARLPDTGYLVVSQVREGTVHSQAVYCIMNGAVKYIHDGGNYQWSTLLWSCCPTRKQQAESYYGSYEHFATHALMMARFPEIKSSASVKAPQRLLSSEKASLTHFLANSFSYYIDVLETRASRCRS